MERAATLGLGQRGVPPPGIGIAGRCPREPIEQGPNPEEGPSADDGELPPLDHAGDRQRRPIGIARGIHGLARIDDVDQMMRHAGSLL